MINKIKQAILRKSVLSILITAGILATLVLGSLPTQAVSLDIQNLPPTMCTGYCYSFYVDGYLQANENIPIDRLRLDFSGPTPAFFETNSPYGNITNQSGQFTFEPLPNQAPGWGYGYDYGYGYLQGYGYGYQEGISPTGYGYFSHDWGYGYGLGYGYGYQLPQQLRGRVTFCVVGMVPGDYTAQLSIWTGPGAKRFLSPVYDFTIMSCGGGPGGGSPGDTTPPVITNLRNCPGTLTDTTAGICWTTNEPATSQVEYWASPSMLSPLDTALVLEHHTELTGLTPGTTYHYKTMSRDAAGNLTISPESTFITTGSTPETTPATTPPETTPPETTPPETTPPETTPTEEAPSAESAVNWGLIIGIIAVVVVIGLIMYFLGRSLRRSV